MDYVLLSSEIIEQFFDENGTIYFLIWGMNNIKQLRIKKKLVTFALFLINDHTFLSCSTIIVCKYDFC